MSTEEIKGRCEDVRSNVKSVEKECREIKRQLEVDMRSQEQAFAGQHSEMLAQITLAFRHLEDARMRIGKVIQYSGDGVSVYDK